jgi:uracil-DNA glycosylase
MSQHAEGSPPELERHLRGHLDSLRSAGVEWLPAGGPAPIPTPIVEAESAIRPATLFEEDATETPLVAPVEERRRDLTLLAERVASCTRCSELARTRTQTVFGVGSIDPPICFVGEAPGEHEDLRGEPFVGNAGQLLNRIIIACGFARSDVYICNIIRCRPPGNRPPLADEADNCREYLERQLELVHPKFLCALGACAAQNLLNTKRSIGQLRGKFHDYRGIPVLCTFHPSYLLRTPERKKDVWEDMKKLLARMGRPVQGK